MKAKSRKRLLISSVAMLLVAMLALGTATFAWFTVDTTAHANDLSVASSKASSLTVAKATGDFKSIINYTEESNANGVLRPVSSADGTNWYTTQAESGSGYAQKSGTSDNKVPSSVAYKITSNTGFLFANQLNVRNEGSAMENVKIEFTLDDSDTNYDYLRIALVPTTEQGTGKANIIATGKSFADYIYAVDATEEWQPANGIDNTTGMLTTVAAANKFSIITANQATSGTFTLEIGDMDAYTGSTYDTRYYNLYVWFEGQDDDCENAQSGLTIPAFNFTISGDVAD